MPVIPPLWINQLTNNAEDMRRDIGGLTLGGATAASPRTGILDPRALALSLSGSTVNVGPGQCMIGSDRGGYLTGVDSVTAAGVLGAADATNPRLDRVVLEVLDPDNGSAGTDRLARLRLITGNPAAVPGLPAQPPLSITLGQVSVPASGAGNPVVTVTAPMTSAAGAVLRVRTATERDALPSAQKWVGLVVSVDSLAGSQFRWNGTVWVPTLTNVGIPFVPTWSGQQSWGSGFISKGMYWRDGDRVRAQMMMQAGSSPSLGLGTISVTLPPGLPTASDFLIIGAGAHSSQFASGSLKTLVPAAGPNSNSATVWAVPDGINYKTPGSAGYAWIANSAFHLWLEYQTSAAV